MSTWDTDDDETRLRKLMDDPWPAYSEPRRLPSWIFWLSQAACVGMIWESAVAVGMGKAPSWLGGIGVGIAAAIIWMLELADRSSD